MKLYFTKEERYPDFQMKEKDCAEYFVRVNFLLYFLFHFISWSYAKMQNYLYDNLGVKTVKDVPINPYSIQWYRVHLDVGKEKYGSSSNDKAKSDILNK